MNKVKKSLKTESLLVLLLAGFIAVGFFFFVNTLGNFLLDKYFQTSSYLEHSNERCLDKFEKFVRENKITTTDTAKIEEWVQKQRAGYVAITILHNHKILYDSLKNLEEEDLELYPAEVNRELYLAGINRELAFEDVTATVYLKGYFDYQFYVNTMIVEIILSVVLFLGILIRFIQKKIDYIVKLEKEVKILETGGMDYKITVEGNDELASLAEGLNQMRITLLDNMQKEEEAVQANYNLVVSVAHDLRTPLTALLLYLDILHKGQYSEKEQPAAYIERSRIKATQIKRMSDQLFERFLVSTEEKKQPALLQKAQVFFEDMLSEMVGYLAEQQFTVEMNINWPNVYVSLYFDYVGRMFDNISSNITKYAFIEKPIRIEVLQIDEWLVLKFANAIANEKIKMESTSIGVQNISTMMQRMGGNCTVHQTNQDYELELWFATVNNKM